jgi:DNA-binding beta-propeller fold protein YncE
VGSISESGVARRTVPVGVGILVMVFSALLWIASSAQAAETIYWDNYDANPDSVAFASIDGSGGGALSLSGATAFEAPEGMAYDTVTNRLFVANSGGPGNGQITFVNLDGSGAGTFSAPGAPVEEPEGVAIDPSTRTIYWNNTDTETISWARLDGSAGGVLNTAGTSLDGAYRIALDPVAGRVYWGNNVPGADSVFFASVNNTGGGSLNIAGATPPSSIAGIVVDTVAGRVYWVNQGDEKISFASLGGAGGGDVNLAGGVFDEPYGLALDPSAGKLYWANYGQGTARPSAIAFAATAGGGGNINIATAPVSGPQDPVILKSPSGTGAPTVTRSTKSQSSLSCSAGSWAADYPGSFTYQSPRAFAYQWTRNGAPIAGATTTTFNAKPAAQYGCIVTATNQTGSASQASVALKVKAAKVKLNVKKKVTAKAGGVAKFKVKAVNQGDIQSKKARACVKLPKSAKGVLKAPKCATLGKLKGRGKRAATLKVKVGKSAAGTYKVTFSVHGSAGTVAKAKILVVAPKTK